MNFSMKVKEIINLTPHVITIMDDNTNILRVIEPSGQLARVSVHTAHTETIEFDNIEIATSESVYGTVEGLPEEKDGVIYIVASLVAQRVPEMMFLFQMNLSVMTTEE